MVAAKPFYYKLVHDYKIWKECTWAWLKGKRSKAQVKR